MTKRRATKEMTKESLGKTGLYKKTSNFCFKIIIKNVKQQTHTNISNKYDEENINVLSLLSMYME